MGITKQSGKSVYIDDTWRLETGQKVGDYTGRELDISEDDAASKLIGYVKGKYESTNGGWKGSGTCTYTDQDGDELYESWEEDSNKGTYKTTGGTGKYKGASGSGTYNLDPGGFAEPLSGGTYNYNGKLELR
jgi:hypothetical protein